MLAAVGRGGQPILGLPGNPVSVMVTARRFAAVVLRHLAGLSCPSPPAPTVTLANPDQKRLPLWWYRPVRLTSCGVAELAAVKGSGDLVGAARSDGFVEIPPHSGGTGPWPFWRWTP
jgi:molybdopterin biosynthesis enzyme